MVPQFPYVRLSVVNTVAIILPKACEWMIPLSSTRVVPWKLRIDRLVRSLFDVVDIAKHLMIRCLMLHKISQLLNLGQKSKRVLSQFERRLTLHRSRVVYSTKVVGLGLRQRCLPTTANLNQRFPNNHKYCPFNMRRIYTCYQFISPIRKCQ